MSKVVQFSLFATGALFVYMGAHYTVVSAYPKVVSVQPLPDTTQTSVDTLSIADSTVVDNSGDVITNEDIVSAAAPAATPAASSAAKEAPAPSSTPIKKSATETPASAKSDKKQVSPGTSQPKSGDGKTVIVRKANETATKETIVKEKNKDNSKTVIVNSKKDSGESGSGRYKVMAGSYLVKENAEKMVERLASMGYSQAEIVPNGKMFAVIAARYESETKAREVSDILKRKQIDSFVKSQ